MKIIKGTGAPVREIDGERRRYHLFEEVELITTWVPPHSAQNWHRHLEIYELAYVAEGEIVVADREHRVTASAGDAVLFSPETSFHSIYNETDRTALILTVKFKPSSDSCHRLFEQDKQEQG